MKNAKLIALSAMTTALATVFLVIGNWFPTFSLSGAFMASIVIMLPLSKGSFKGALLSYLATFILSGIFSGFFVRWDALFPFAVFSGLHPIVNEFVEQKRFNKALVFVVKEVWFVGAVVSTHLLTKLYVGDNEFLNEYILPILIVGGALVLPIYDILMRRFQRMLNVIIKRLDL